ncbi:MAG: GyrI-like domain-containing protein [Candidatus Thorarchaeota archaeon]|nr:MAG: GyrI-like domain-containing protein [Candidatus Thorarchaeota archaeon]
MSEEKHKYEHKHIDDMLIAFIRAPVFRRDDLKERFKKLEEVCGERICGPAMAIYRWDTDVKEGLDMEAAYPVSEAIESGEIHSRILPGFEAFTTVYKGPYDQMAKVFGELHDYRASRGLAAELNPREVYLKGPFEDNPEDNVTELQTTIHPWESRFKDRTRKVLGEQKGSMVLEGSKKITPLSSAEERSDWVVTAIERLDRIADEDQKCQVIAKCAHDRPVEDIQRFKEIFDKTQDIDEVLRAYGKDQPWVEKPYREDQILYTSKPPSDLEAYAKARTQDEIIKAYCYCPIVKAALERMPRIFCYCGAGWAEQLWNEVLGEPLKIDIVSTVVDGGKLCKFAVYLPEHAVKGMKTG